MDRAKHLDRLRNMLRQVAPQSALESAFESPSTGFEAIEIPDQRRDAAVEGWRRLNSSESVRENAIDGEQQFALEAIILPTLRPVVNIIGDTFSPPPSPWEHLSSNGFKQRIDKVISSIGRVEVPGHPSVPYGGTGFIVGLNLLMTNRHVAEIFATGLGQQRLAFIPGRMAAMDFKREVIETVPELLTVTKVVMIHPYWDMALLEVSGLSAARPVLPISVKPPQELSEREVVVIGYPAQDWRSNIALQKEIFGGIFNVKRLQPGKLKLVRSIESFGHEVIAITHDASTLGGNSGSAVIDALTGEVVALHFAGMYLDANFGVPTFELARDSRVVQAGVNFQGTVAPTADWAAIWRLADQGPETPRPAPVIGTGTLQSPNGNIGNTATLTIPLQVSVTISTPVLGGGPALAVAAPTAPVVAAPVPGPSEVALERAIEEAVARAYAKFDAASLASSHFSWKPALSTAVCSHLGYELPAIIVTTARDRWEMQSCEFLQTDATECFVAATNDTMIVAFRGTAGLRDWLGNLNAFSTTASYGHVHRGFYFAFQAVKASLERIIREIGPDDRKLVITGHSLGGALANIAAAEWQGVFDIRGIYTYGQPRVGKSDFAGYMRQHYGSTFFRIVNDDDIVPRVPPGYVHVGQLFRFGPRGSVSNEAFAQPLAASEPEPLSDAQFAELKASLRLTPPTVTTEGVGLEGFFPSFSDHRLSNYLAKILKQPL